jgi:hypothetical protein
MHVQRPQVSKPLPEIVAQSIESSNNIWYLKFKFSNFSASGGMPLRTPRQLVGVDPIRLNATQFLVLNPFKVDALPKKYLPLISTSLLFEGIFAAHILHGSFSIAIQHRKLYQRNN